MKASAIIALGRALVIIALGVAMGGYGSMTAYNYGYEDGVRHTIDNIKYELHKHSRARIIQETEDLNSTPEA